MKEKEPLIFKENNEFIDCDPSIECDLVFIKSEASELEGTELKLENFRSKNQRKSVEKDNHNQKNENNVSFCDTCGHETTKMEMEIHMKIHVKKESFYCEFCSREFVKVS